MSKLTIFGFLLATIPVLFIGAYAYFTTTSEIHKNVSAGKMQLLMQINSNVEQKLTTVNHTLNQVIHSTVMKTALGQPLMPSDFVVYDNLRSEIRYMQTFETRLSDVVLINQRHNWLVKNSGLYAFDQYAYRNELGRLAEDKDASGWMLTPAEWFYSEEAAGTAGCAYNISLVKKLPATGTDQYGLALANIPACSLLELIAQDAEAGSGMMIMDEQYRILLHSDQSLIGKPASEAGIHPSSLDGAEGQFTSMIDKEDYSISYYRSGLNGWIYLSTTSVAGMTKQADSIGSYALYVCLILLLLSLLFAWAGSRRMYSPIRRLLLQLGERGGELNAPQTNEFQAIADRVSHLFQSQTALESELRQHVPQVRAFFLIRACQGSIKPHEIEEKLEQFGYGPQLGEWRSMATVALQIDYSEDSRYSREDQELLLFAVHNMLEELIPIHLRLHPVIMDQMIVVVIGSDEQEDEPFGTMTYDLTERMQQQIDSFLGVEVSIGISLPFSSMSLLAGSYREACEALKHRIKLGGGIIISYANINAGKPYLSPGYPLHIENELLDAIRLADKEKAKELVRTFMQAVFAAELAPHEYQIPLARLLNNLLIVMQESGISQTQLHPSGVSLLEELLDIRTAAEIEDWFWTMAVYPLVRIFKDRQTEQYHNLSEQIIDLIQRCYDTDLTLEECAQRLHYNANYLSSVFRKETGHSFSEYLTMYRFQMARKWLETSEIPIKDIAAKLCYTNPQNFIRSFRKQEGITPGQYREKRRTG
ncbi:helix-turn-helix domain-containing protein [Paenibacillus sp. CAU 1782]